jgi:hypothetical protein
MYSKELGMRELQNNTASSKAIEIVSEDSIRAMIMPVRGQQVMLDRDLAILYGVEVKYLNRQVKRNIERFPADFMFQLTKEDCLRCQIGTLNGKCGEHLKYMPYRSRSERNLLEDAPKKRTCVSVGRFGESRTRRAHKRPRRIPERRGAIDFAAAKMGAEVIPGLLESIRKAAMERLEYGKGKMAADAKVGA